MAYDTEKNRMISEITSVVGISRQRDGALEREATERAFEARQQTGLTYDGPEDYIKHPTFTERQIRLDIPASVGTAELATWNYMYLDPIDAAIDGLLSSPPHRYVLDNAAYDHWGFGIYTEMPPGDTEELNRRWWIVIWLATEPIDKAMQAQPQQMFASGKRVYFSKGSYTGFKFGYDGNVLEKKTAEFAKSRSEVADGRGSIPNQSGTFLRMSTGALEGLWVREKGFWARKDAVG